MSQNEFNNQLKRQFKRNYLIVPRFSQNRTECRFPLSCLFQRHRGGSKRQTGISLHTSIYKCMFLEMAPLLLYIFFRISERQNIKQMKTSDCFVYILSSVSQSKSGSSIENQPCINIDLSFHVPIENNITHACSAMPSEMPELHAELDYTVQSRTQCFQLMHSTYVTWFFYHSAVHFKSLCSGPGT